MAKSKKPSSVRRSKRLTKQSKLSEKSEGSAGSGDPLCDASSEEEMVDFHGLIPELVLKFMRRHNPRIHRQLEKAARRGEAFLKRFLDLMPKSKEEIVEWELFLARGAVLEELDNADMDLLSNPSKWLPAANKCAYRFDSLEAAKELSVDRFDSLEEELCLIFNIKDKLGRAIIVDDLDAQMLNDASAVGIIPSLNADNAGCFDSLLSNAISQDSLRLEDPLSGLLSAKADNALSTTFRDDSYAATAPITKKNQNSSTLSDSVVIFHNFEGWAGLSKSSNCAADLSATIFDEFSNSYAANFSESEMLQHKDQSAAINPLNLATLNPVLNTDLPSLGTGTNFVRPDPADAVTLSSLPAQEDVVSATISSEKGHAADLELLTIAPGTVGEAINLDVPPPVSLINGINRHQHNEPAASPQGKGLVGNRKITKRVMVPIIPNVAKDVYEISKEDVQDVEPDWQNILIGVLVGKRIPYNDLIDFMKANWLVPSPKLFTKPNGVMIFRFNSEEDRLWVLENGPWLVEDAKPLLLKKWKVGMPVDWSCFKSIPVWTKIMDIDPMLLSSKHMLAIIGNMIGKPISMDSISYDVERISYARLLIEVTQDEIKRKEVVLKHYDGTIFRHQVVFEWTPWSCDLCHTFGHSTHFCHLMEKEEELVNEQESAKLWKGRSFRNVVREGSKARAKSGRQGVDNGKGSLKWVPRIIPRSNLILEEKEKGILPTPNRSDNDARCDRTSPLERNEENFPPL